MLVIFNKLTYYLLERKAVCKPATTRREETNAGTTQMTALVKGSDVLKDHLLNRLMTGRCPHTSLQLRPKFHSLSLQNSFDFQKVLHLKHLNRHLECIDVNFKPENGAFSKIKNRQTHRQTTTVTLSAHAR